MVTNCILSIPTSPLTVVSFTSMTFSILLAIYILCVGIQFSSVKLRTSQHFRLRFLVAVVLVINRILHFVYTILYALGASAGQCETQQQTKKTGYVYRISGKSNLFSSTIHNVHHNALACIFDIESLC